MAKRFFDIFAVLLSVPIWFPIILAIYICVAIQMGFPVFFRQKRPGKNGEIFELIKFRTMKNTRDEEGNLLPDADRLTGFGRFLRSTSLDELPELFNILRGEMSLVGPRPLLASYLDRYTPEQSRRP